jgi:hypothetical protein
MYELTSVMQEKLNDPQIVFKLTENILLNSGRYDLAFESHKDLFYRGVHYNYLDLPANHIILAGHFEIRENEDLAKFLRQDNIDGYEEGLDLDQYLRENTKILYSFSELFKKVPKKLSGIQISWNKSKINFDFRDVFRVYKNPFDNRVDLFEKGEWQDYLCTIYLAEIALRKDSDKILLS